MKTQSNARVRVVAIGAGCGILALGASFAVSPALAGRTITSGVAAVGKTCNSGNPCFQRQNAGVGPGVRSGSAGGNGLVGQTTFFSTRSGAAGVSGLDLATPNPQGTPLNNAGVSGTSPAGTGVLGQTTSGIGLRGIADTGTAVAANSNGGDGLFGTTQSNIAHVSSAGVFGEDVGSSNSAYGVLGFSRTGIGVQGDNFEVGINLNAAVVGLTFASNLTTYFPTYPTGALFNSDTGEGVVAETSGGQAEALSAANFGGGPVMRGYAARTEVVEIDNAGNMILAGKLTAHGHPGAITHTVGAGDVVMYPPSEASATVEDVGEARLAGGQTYVRIEPRFRATMREGRPYLVFVTPQGDTNGLYVTEKTPTGFSVREHGGQSNIAFDYRIVAEPVDGAGARLPAAPHLTGGHFARSSTTHRSDFVANKGVQRH